MDRSGRCSPILGARRPLDVVIYGGSLPVQRVQRSRALTTLYDVVIPDSQPLLNSDSDNDTIDCHGHTDCNFDEAIKPICFRMMVLDPPAVDVSLGKSPGWGRRGGGGPWMGKPPSVKERVGPACTVQLSPAGEETGAGIQLPESKVGLQPP